MPIVHSRRPHAILGALALVALLPAAGRPQGADDGRPLRAVGDGVELVFVDRVSAGRVADDRLLPFLINACAGEFPLDSDQRARLLATPWLRPWSGAPEDSAWAIELYAFPRDSSRAPCSAEAVPALAAALRGLHFSAADAPQVGERITDAVVLVDGVPERLEPTQRFSLTRVGAWGTARTDSAVVRVGFAMDRLVPDASGALPEVAVQVQLADRAAPVRVVVPPDLVSALWTRALPSRLEHVSLQGLDADVLAIAPPPPRDRELARARDAFLDEDAAEAARIALVRLDDDSLSVADRRIARVLAGLAFLSYGDAAGARLLLASVVRDDPCFALAPGGSRTVSDLLAGLSRPRARCVPAQFVRVALRGALLPGFGRPTSRARVATGIIEAGLVAGAFTISRNRLRTARNQYEEYMAVSPLQPFAEFPSRRAARLYNQADDTRREAEQYLYIAIGLWGAALAEALIAESEWGNYFDDIATYGAPREAPRVAIRPFADGGRIGLALAWR